MSPVCPRHSILLVAESPECLGVPAPVFLNPDKEFQKHLSADHAFDLLAGIFTDLFEFTAFFTYQDSFLRITLHVDSGIDGNQGPVLFFGKPVYGYGNRIKTSI